MALERFAPAILIVNGIPLSFPATAVGGWQVTQNSTSSIQIDGGVENQVFLIGTSSPVLASSFGALVQKDIISTRFSVSFFIENQGTGLVFTDILLPLLDSLKRAIDIPCQFIYAGYYMILGYLENYTSSFVEGETRVEVTLDFQENIYRFFADETGATFVGNVGKLEGL